MQIRHETLNVDGHAEEVVVLEGTKDEAVRILGSVSFEAPVLIRFQSKPSALSTPRPSTARPQVPQGLAPAELMSIIRTQPKRYRGALQEFVEANPTLGPSDFFRTFFGVNVSAHGPTRLLFNSLYIRMRTIRKQLGLPGSIGRTGSRMREPVRQKTLVETAAGAPDDAIPKPSVVRDFVESLVTSGRTVSTHDLQGHFFGQNFNPSSNGTDHLKNKRLMDYGAYARKSLSRTLGGHWMRVGPSGGSNVTWRFVRDGGQASTP
jgi:hypothetical protein